jgi:hypothetical protein
MKEKLWNWILGTTPEGQLLTPWQIAAYALLWPLDFLFWHLSKTRGYQFWDDTWLIHGTRWSSASLRYLSRADGKLLKVTRRDGDLVTIEICETESPSCKSN